LLVAQTADQMVALWAVPSVALLVAQLVGPTAVRLGNHN